MLYRAQSVYAGMTRLIWLAVQAFLTTTQGRLFAFCTTRDNFDNVLCKNTIEKHPCIAAPFGAECGEKYEPIRIERTAFCAQGDNVSRRIMHGRNHRPAVFA